MSRPALPGVPALVATLALTLAVGTVPAAGAAPAAPAGAGEALTWGACPAEDLVGVPDSPLRAELQCATATVPVDYSRPDGRTIDVDVRRLPSTGPRIGALFGNPGGPGVDARSMWIRAVDVYDTSALDEIRRSRDLVAVQPRGLTGSGELECTDPGDDASGVVLAVMCHEKDPEFVGSITTENLVRDADRVRELMGLERVSFLGHSYGTAVGMAYQALFPERLDRLVLDSSVGPSPYWWKESEAVNEGGWKPARDLFLAWIGENDSFYHLGATALEVYRTLRERDLREGNEVTRYLPPPATSADLATGSVGSVTTGSFDLGLELGVRLDNAARQGAGRHDPDPGIPPGPPLLGMLDANSSFPSWWAHDAGQIANRVHGYGWRTYAPAALSPGGMEPLSDEPGAEPLWQAEGPRRTTADAEAYLRILRCNEDTHSPDPAQEELAEFATGLGSTMDVVAPMYRRATPCPWPPTTVPPETRPHRLPVPPLVLQSDADRFTNTVFGPLTAEATGGVLVRVRGGQHSMVGYGHPQVDALVAEYFRTGQVEAGLHLPAAPPPEAR